MTSILGRSKRSLQDIEGVGNNRGTNLARVKLNYLPSQSNDGGDTERGNTENKEEKPVLTPVLIALVVLFAVILFLVMLLVQRRRKRSTPPASPTNTITVIGKGGKTRVISSGHPNNDPDNTEVWVLQHRNILYAKDHDPSLKRYKISKRYSGLWDTDTCNYLTWNLPWRNRTCVSWEIVKNTSYTTSNSKEKDGVKDFSHVTRVLYSTHDNVLIAQMQWWKSHWKRIHMELSNFYSQNTHTLPNQAFLMCHLCNPSLSVCCWRRIGVLQYEVVWILLARAFLGVYIEEWTLQILWYLWFGPYLATKFGLIIRGLATLLSGTCILYK